jgi:hypothetical protein
MAKKLKGINSINSRFMDLSLKFALQEINGPGVAGMTG